MRCYNTSYNSSGSLETVQYFAQLMCLLRNFGRSDNLPLPTDYCEHADTDY